MTPTTFAVVLPTFRPVGGVVKCLDYATHAASLGLNIAFYCDDKPELFLKLCDHVAVPAASFGDYTIGKRRDVPLSRDHVFMISLARDFRFLEPLMARGLPAENVIHILQGVRNADPEFHDGYAIRLLSRPMQRLAVSEQIMSAVTPYLCEGGIAECIPMGHRCDFFATGKPRPAPSAPFKVGYTTWKSDIGDDVQAHFENDPRFEFVRLDGFVSWAQLRDFYREIDVMLCTPSPSEGFFLPGLEAMAAGVVVLIPDVGGNLSYCRYGENALQYDYDSVESAVSVLEGLAGAPQEQVLALIRAAEKTPESFDIGAERKAFGRFWARIASAASQDADDRSP